MDEEILDLAVDHQVAALLRDELARENRAMSAVVPVLRHLLASEAQTLLSDAILARVRGMIFDCAAQLVAALENRDPAMRAISQTDQALLEHHAEALLENEALLGFCHALANESLLAERFQQRHAIDPVLSPLLQELIASEDPAIASLAMSALAAQSRFIQTQRRMELPLGELPAELFHAVIARIQNDGQPGMARLRASYDEAVSRLGLLARLVAAMRRGALAALALDHAGLALFASALAAHNHLSRAAGVLACHQGQGVRLALALRAAELSLPAIERQLLLVGPVSRMPRVIATLSSTQAAALLAMGSAA